MMDYRELTSGLVFVAVGAFFAFDSLAKLDIGTAFRMGPGYFPLMLGGLLALLGAILVIKGLLARTVPAGGGEAAAPLPWRGMLFIAAAIVAFGFTVRGLGLIGALAILVLMSAFASRRMSIMVAALLAAGIAVFCVAVFVHGLGVVISPVGPWLAR